MTFEQIKEIARIMDEAALTPAEIDAEMRRLVKQIEPIVDAECEE